MKIKLFILGILLLNLVINGCVNVSVIPLGNHELYSHKNNVIVFANRESIKKEFEEIAIILSKSDAGFVSDNVIMEEIILKAQEIGADAIIFEEDNSSDFTQSVRVTAIRYKD